MFCTARDDVGYSVNQVSDNFCVIDVGEDLKSGLYGDIEALESGSPPGTIKAEDYDGTEQWGRYDSTYPEWFKGRDWAAKDAVTALKKATEVEKLGSREAKMVEYALEYMNEEKALYEFQESERKKEDGHSDKDIERVRGESEEDGIQEANDEAERRKSSPVSAGGTANFQLTPGGFTEDDKRSLGVGNLRACPICRTILFLKRTQALDSS